VTTQLAVRQRRVRYRNRSGAVRILAPSLSVILWGPGILTIGVGITTGRGQRVDSYHFSYHFDPVTQTDPERIAATYAGRVAREIYDRVLAYQGPSGFLATKQDQKHVPANAGYLVPGVSNAPPPGWAYWSPDGEFGRTTAKPRDRQWMPTGSPAPRPAPPGLLIRVQYRLRLIRHKLQRRGSKFHRDTFR
jgi:hypothetical protein